MDLLFALMGRQGHTISLKVQVSIRPNLFYILKEEDGVEVLLSLQPFKVATREAIQHSEVLNNIQILLILLTMEFYQVISQKILDSMIGQEYSLNIVTDLDIKGPDLNLLILKIKNYILGGKT